MSERRLVINPEPLKFVDARPGEPQPPVMSLSTLRGETPWRVDDVLTLSVHVMGCSDIPDGEGWTSTPASEEQIKVVVGVCVRADMPISTKCRSCGGWRGSELP